jgi:ribose transport system substrate-binding protein
MRPRVTFLLALILLTPAASCGPARSAGDGKPRFAFVINVPGRFWDIAHAGCVKAAEEEGVEVEFHVPGASTAAQQKQIVEDLVSKGIDGLAITPLNPQSMTVVLNQAAESMPVVCMDSDAPDSRRTCYIGTDNVDLGRQVGNELKKVLPGGGRVALFVGQLDVGNARERQQGVLEALKGSRLEVIGTYTDGADRPTARSNAADVLTRNPDLKGIAGLWGYNAPAAVKALEDHPGRDVKVVGTDEEAETILALRQGKMEASVAQQPFEFGYRSIKMLASLHRGERVELPRNRTIFVPTYRIDHRNVEEVESAVNRYLAILNRHQSR